MPEGKKYPTPGRPRTRATKVGKGKPSSISPTKAKKILSDGEVRGQKLTSAQRGFFGARAGGSSDLTRRQVDILKRHGNKRMG